MSLREKCPYSELFWSAFYRIRTLFTQLIAIIHIHTSRAIFLTASFDRVSNINSQHRNFNRHEWRK